MTLCLQGSQPPSLRIRKRHNEHRHNNKKSVHALLVKLPF